MSQTNFFSKVAAFINSTSHIFAISAAICIVIMVVVTNTDIIRRDFWNAPITGVTEFDSLLLTTAIFLSLAYTQYLRAHIRIEVLTHRFSQRTQQVLDLVMLFLGLAFFSWAVWGTTGQAVVSWGLLEVEFGFSRFPLYWAKTVIPIGCFLYCLVVVTQIVQRIGELRRHAPMAGAPSSPEAPAIG